MDATELARSIARLGVAIATADRRVTAEELVALGRLDALGLGSLADTVRGELQRATREPVDVPATCAALPRLNEQAGILVLTVLAEIAASDGALSAPERDVFIDVAERLGVDSTAAARILAATRSDEAETDWRRGRESVAPYARREPITAGSPQMERALHVLGLAPGASRSTIEAAYVDLVQRYDPAGVAELGAEFAALAVRRLATVTEAYDVALAVASSST